MPETPDPEIQAEIKKLIVGRKDWTCAVCGKLIRAGQTHWQHSIKKNDLWQNDHIHVACMPKK